MTSKPLVLPGRHLINISLLGANALTFGAFLTMAPKAPLIAAACLGGNTVLSFLKGFTTTAAIGGADMRKCAPTSSVRACTDLCCLAVVITVLNAYSGFALVAEGMCLHWRRLHCIHREIFCQDLCWTIPC